MLARQEILTTEPDNVYDDQQFVLNKNELLISDCFFPIESVSDESFESLRRYWIHFDLCGTMATRDTRFTVYYCMTLAGTTADIALYHVESATRYTASCAYSATMVWKNAWTTASIDSDGTLNTYELQVQRTAGSGEVLVGGVAMYTKNL